MTDRKKFLITIGILWGVPVAALLAAGIWFSHAGVVSVKVDEHRRGGDRVQVTVPGALVQVALAVIPAEVCASAAEEIGEHGPLIRAVCSELSKCPDAVLVDVSGDGEQVTVAKKGNHLVVDVESEDESVHVKLPLSTVTAFLSRIERAAEHDGGVSRDHGRIRIDGHMDFDHDPGPDDRRIDRTNPGDESRERRRAARSGSDEDA